MRVLFLCHQYSDISIGGVAEFLHHLPLALKQYGIESFLYTRAKEKNEKSLVGPDVLPNGMLHYTGPFLKPRWLISPKALEPLIQLCKKEKIDLIHAQGTYRAGYMAMQLKKRLNIPYIVTSHSDILETNSKRLKKISVKARLKKVLKNADYVTHLTHSMAEASHAHYPTIEKSKIIQNGIDVNAWHPFIQQVEQDYMLAIGRLEPGKGFDVLIQVYAELKKQPITDAFVIAGSGSAKERLKNQIHDLQLEMDDQAGLEAIQKGKIIFTGYVRDSAKKQLFANAKIILFATQPHQWDEAFGIVLLEAMAAGKAIVASDIPSTRYLQSLGLNALLVKADDLKAWREAIKSLLNDKTQRQLLGNQNLLNVHRFDWSRIAKEYAECYQRVGS
ncbi:MAG: hypothetical protein A3F12_04035 [Gammaproteobacteria bacterium RIFCSPHIGHO2_12_FULL_38_14]|nr:MAG: hypothetical protein A3F12_04035 [Gammaproteobacteria bacterium RIFCSPHIGHO2_12_FULL_38_14]